ncbi:hypothetical protein [Kineosporia sp. R_H_3]|uniref:hypothetical protein n=1 Tax=Kineosporia sp. R_H_3 TaxID=1961848 RepID=UPI000B4AC64D|nr:hypothetical protein [Kineosporia sp. R_H_3]
MSAVRLAVAARRAAARAAATSVSPSVTDRAAARSRTEHDALLDGTDRCLETDIRLRLARTQPRSTDMYASQHVLNEQLARHRWHELSSEAQRSRVVRAVRAERRARRAERSAQRAVQSARLASQAALRAAQQLV